jgi:hypothetical protein
MLQLIIMMALIAFPCGITAVTLAFLGAVNDDRTLLLTSMWLNRAADGCAVIVWAALIRFLWRDRRRRKGRGCR